MTFLVLSLMTLLIAVGISLVLRPWFKTWGARPEEVAMTMPGAEALEPFGRLSTHAITIDADARSIWPWLVQIGQNRGGFYSYRWLENLFGCHMPKVDVIEPRLQNLQLGDSVFLHPKAPPLRITYLSPGEALAMGGWYLLLVPEGDRTRLITRSYNWQDPAKPKGIEDYIFRGPFFDFAHWLMEQKMLRTIKVLAEKPSKAIAGL